MTMITVQQISACIRANDASIIDTVAAKVGATFAGTVSHAMHFRKQTRDGNFVSDASLQLPAGFREKLSADTARRRLTAAALVLGHGLSKSAYDAFYRSGCGLPASYDTVTQDFSALLAETVCVTVLARFALTISCQHCNRRYRRTE